MHCHKTSKDTNNHIKDIPLFTLDNVGTAFKLSFFTMFTEKFISIHAVVNI